MFSIINSKKVDIDITVLYTAVSRKVVQLKSIIKAYATTPKGMMGCGCSLLNRQVHEFSAQWKVGAMKYLKQNGF